MGVRVGEGTRRTLGVTVGKGPIGGVSRGLATYDPMGITKPRTGPENSAPHIQFSFVPLIPWGTVVAHECWSAVRLRCYSCVRGGLIVETPAKARSVIALLTVVLSTALLVLMLCLTELGTGSSTQMAPSTARAAAALSAAPAHRVRLRGANQRVARPWAVDGLVPVQAVATSTRRANPILGRRSPAHTSTRQRVTAGSRRPRVSAASAP